MKAFATILTLALFQAAPPSQEPQLSAAEKTAIQALETQKKQSQDQAQQAHDQFLAAQQQESIIEHEFAANHAGWHINAMTLAVEKDAAKQPEPKKP